MSQERVNAHNRKDAPCKNFRKTKWGEFIKGAIRERGGKVQPPAVPARIKKKEFYEGRMGEGITKGM